MQVQSIKFNTNRCEGNLKAFVSLDFHGLILKGIKLFGKKDEEKLFISMPSQKVGEVYKDLFYFIEQKQKEELEKIIIEAWKAK